jgi:hypothetical protein
MAQTAVDAAQSSRILNAMLPVGTAGVPGTALTAYNAGAMFLKLTSTASTGAASGTELANTGGGYTTNGLAFSNVSGSGVSSAGSNVTMPGVAAMSWTMTFAASIQSLEITDHVQVRGFFGNWTGAPIAVANGNTFSVAVSAISAGGM